jgi:shikimate dehydrogenase
VGRCSLESPAARGLGCPTTNGLGMLLHQGALAFERWTGLPAPREVMRTALLAALEKS